MHDFDQRWAAALGGQLIAPTSTNGVAMDAWEQVTGFVVRAMLPEISPGSYFAPQVRYGIDFEGNDDGRMLRQLRIAPTLNINLPHNLFFTLYPSPDIRLNYGRRYGIRRADCFCRSTDELPAWSGAFCFLGLLSS